MAIITSDKVSLYTKVSGIGFPTIYVHGGPGAWSYTFEMFGGGKLESFMKMIYYDQRGCGRSSEPMNNNYTLERNLEDINEIRKKLNFDKINLICHSFGGIIGVNYSYKYSMYVNKLILINTSLNIINSMKSQIEKGLFLLDKKNIKIDNSSNIFELWGKVIRRLIEKNLYYKLYYSDYNNYLNIKNFEKNMNKSSKYKNFVYKNDEYLKNHSEITSLINLPVYIICGLRDYSVGINHYKDFKFKNKHISKIDSGHMLYYEKNNEFAKLIENYILN